MVYNNYIKVTVLYTIARTQGKAILYAPVAKKPQPFSALAAIRLGLRSCVRGYVQQIKEMS